MTDTSSKAKLFPSTTDHVGGAVWPLDSAYRYEREGHRLSRTVRGVTGGQVAAFRGGEFELALVLHDPLLILCSRFGDELPWSAAAFHWQLLPRPMHAPPPPALHDGPGPDPGSPMVAILVAAEDRRVVAERNLLLTPAFARVLHETILEQARYSYDPICARRAIEGLQRRYPGMGGLVAYATVRMKVPGGGA